MNNNTHRRKKSFIHVLVGEGFRVSISFWCHIELQIYRIRIDREWGRSLLFFFYSQPGKSIIFVVAAAVAATKPLMLVSNNVRHGRFIPSKSWSVWFGCNILLLYYTISDQTVRYIAAKTNRPGGIGWIFPHTPLLPGVDVSVNVNTVVVDAVRVGVCCICIPYPSIVRGMRIGKMPSFYSSPVRVVPTWTKREEWTHLLLLYLECCCGCGCGCMYVDIVCTLFDSIVILYAVLCCAVASHPRPEKSVRVFVVCLLWRHPIHPTPFDPYHDEFI